MNMIQVSKVPDRHRFSFVYCIFPHH